MKLIEGRVEIGADRFSDVESFVSELADIGSEYDVTVQAFDARYVVSRRHLERAVEMADRERSRGDSIVRDRGVEITLYAAGRRQIDRAMKMGLSPGMTPVVVLVDGLGNEPAAAEDVRKRLEPDETLGEYDETRVREFYDITATELDATEADIEALVLERVALLVIER